MIAEGPSANRPPHIALEPLLSSFRSVTLAALGLAVLAGGCDRQSGGNAQPQASASAAAKAGELKGKIDRSHKGEPLPDVTVEDPTGKELKLAALKGPLLLNLWATWCAPCVTELPLLDRLAAARAGTLRVLTVSEDMGDGAKVAEFLKGKGVTRLEPWLDPKNDLPFHYGGDTLPTTVYYDAAGREVWRFVGGRDWASPETSAMLAEAR
jgi:thiol-disulfide isomerase/thioredoxin